MGIYASGAQHILLTQMIHFERANINLHTDFQEDAHQPLILYLLSFYGMSSFLTEILKKNNIMR